MKWLPRSRMSRTVRDALAITLMTGARSGEVAVMLWRDIDLKAGTWSIIENKTDQPRTVRLPHQVVAILSERLGLHDEWVFPRPDKLASISQHALVWSTSKYGASSGLAQWSPHDLRRTCRTGLSRLGVRHEVAEAAIGHSKAGIAGTYDLHNFEAEVGVALQQWADHLDALTRPTVTSITRKQA